MASNNVIQIIKETYDEVAAKRNRCMLSLNDLRERHATAVANHRNAESQMSQAKQVVQDIRRKQQELTDYSDTLVQTPHALLQKIEDLSRAILDQESRVSAIEPVVQRAKTHLVERQTELDGTEQQFKTLDAQIKELSAHIATLS